MLKEKKIYPLRTVICFMLVLLCMPLGHALMILMEHFLDETALHYSAFAMGAAGMFVAIAGIFAKGDTRQTIFGLFGGLLFWTGWVEFLFAYYAARYGTHCDLVGSGVVQTTSEYLNGVVVNQEFLVNGIPLEAFDRAGIKAVRGSRPEYLILPATFGMFMMFMMLYIFCTRTGCRFFSWIQKHLSLNVGINFRPMTYLPAMVTFLELNLMMWALYLVLMFCYDPVFLGSDHPVTFTIGFGCLIGSIFMFAKQLRIQPWGANIRMGIATVLVLWTFVEVVARNGLLTEIWVDPLNHLFEMVVISVGFIIVLAAIIIYAGKHRNEKKDAV